MAKLSPTGQISGAIGPVVYTNINGQAILRTKPGKGRIKQTAGTKSSSSTFGQASGISKNIRKALTPIMQGFTDNRMYSRFTAAVYKILKASNESSKGTRSMADGDLTQLDHFQCQLKHPFDMYCSLQPELGFTEDGKLFISLGSFIPSEHIHKVPGAALAELCFLATVVDPVTGDELQAVLHKIPVALKAATIPATQWTTDVIPEGMPVLVTAALFYFREDRLMGPVGLNGKDFHVCEVVRVLIRN